MQQNRVLPKQSYLLPQESFTKETPLSIDLRLAFYLFVASIPMEVYEVFQNVSIPKILAVVFVVIIAVRGKWILRMPEKPFWFFLLYFSMIALSIQWMNPFFFGYWRMRLIQIAQLLLTFWICSILLSYKTLQRGALAFYSYTVLFSITMANLRVPGFVAQEALKIYGERATLGLTDPNTFTFILGVSLIYFIEKFLNYYFEKNKINFWYIIILIYILINITIAGSRGGQIAIFFGLITLLLTGKYNLRKIHIFGLLAFIIALFAVASYFNPEMKERWQETLTEGKASGRETILPESINMIKRKPFLGYGPGEHIYILGPPTGKERRDPHSTFIWVIHEVGLTGGIPFIIGFLLCGYLAFKKIKGRHDNIPFVLFIIALVANNDFTALYDKTTWFILALSAGREFKRH